MNSEQEPHATRPNGPLTPAQQSRLLSIGMNSPKIDPRLRRLGDLLPKTIEAASATGSSTEQARRNAAPVFDAAFDERLAAERQATEALRCESLWLRSGALLQHAYAATDHSERRNVQWQACRKKLGANLGKGIMIAMLGDRGTGKTQLAVDLVRQACECGHPATYVIAIPFFLELRADCAADALNALERYVAPPLLVIDELGLRSHSRWEDNTLTTLFDLRYGGLKDTLLLSNEKPDRFAETIGKSTMQRLLERGGHLTPNGIILCTKANKWENFRES